MVLSSEWSEVEVIDLHNDGNGLGFILVGGRSTGVVIKALIPGGVAERDGRLQCGDHLLYIGEVTLRGFSSEQVATVLRQAGAQVRLVIARPIEPTPNDIKSKPGAIIQTKLLTDADELSRHLSQSPNLAAVINMRDEVSIKFAAESVKVDQPSTDITIPTTGVLSHISNTEPADLPLPPIPKELSDSIAQIHANNDTDIVPFSLVSPPPSVTKHSPKSTDISISSSFVGITSPMDQIDTVMADSKKAGTPSYELTSFDVMPSTYTDSPETETYEVRLRKNVYGLGITVAGYVCEEEDISGIFVKSIIEGSAAEMSGDIQINDRIVAVDGKRLSGVTNHQAVEILRNTDIEVSLTLERFLRGRKFEHLQIALTDLKSCAETQSQASLPPSPSILTLSWLPVKSDADSTATDKSALINENFDLPSLETVDSSISYILDHISIGNEIKKGHLPNGVCADNVLENTETSLQRNSLSAASDAISEPEITSMVNSVPVAGPMTENNNELKRTEPCPDLLKTHPFHCSEESLKVAWKSEFPESEIIVAEINKLSGLGISLEGTVDVECGIEKRPHHYIRSILEHGPVGRQGILKPGDELLQVNEHKLQGLRHTEVIKILKELPSHVKLVCVRSTMPPSVINTSQNPEAFETRSLLPGGHQTLLCLTKAQSESSLYTSSTATFTDQQRYKSLENVSGLELWDTDVTYVEIEKTDQGFGFSILDYQDPVDPDGSVIVIRGLIYGGSAEATKQIFPGDRLVSVGEHTLQGLELDEAVKILKGMPLGITKLGICRPLSTSDSNVASPNGDSDTRST